jgi:acetoin utilization deacetylase AcuC-like enzyme
MRIYTHPSCLRHSAGEGHPESPARLVAVLEALQAEFGDAITWHEAPTASRHQLRRTHTEALVSQILDLAVASSCRLDPDTAMNPHSAEAALRAAGAVCAAIDATMRGDIERAFCAVRPPGHHATPDQAMGFCLFNSIAVGAAHALAEHGLQRVAVVDFDVHHGNGTQDIFWHDARVLFVSSHQRGLYPGSGAADERGLGNVFNAPLPEGCDGEVFRQIWRDCLLPTIDDFRPQLVLVSAGFDAHRLDPLAGLLLEADDYAWITGELVALAARHAQGRLVSTLEGGYSLTALRESSVAHVRALAASA